MVTRRALLQAGMTLPFAAGSVIGCSRQAGPVKSYYRPEMYLENNYGPVDVENDAAIAGVLSMIEDVPRVTSEALAE